MDKEQYAVDIDEDDFTSAFEEITREAFRQAQQAPKLTVTITIDQTVNPALINANYQHDVTAKPTPGDTSQRINSGAEIHRLSEKRTRFDRLMDAWLAAVD